MDSQKRMFVVLLVALVVIGTATIAVAKDYPMGVAPKQEVTFNQPTVVGGTLLPAGDYKVQHQMDGSEHVMVFQKIGGKAGAKVKCNLVPLDGKVKSTEMRYTENAKSERVLMEMQFQGDSAKHILVQ